MEKFVTSNMRSLIATAINFRPMGFWDRRSTLQKALIALAVVALVAVVIVAIVLTVVKTGPSDDPDHGKTVTLLPFAFFFFLCLSHDAPRCK